MVRVKKNATICKICVPLFDKKRGCFASHFYGLTLDLCEKCRNIVLRRFLPKVSQCQFFAPQSKALYKTVHFQELRHTCKEDGALLQITALKECLATWN